MCNALLTCGAHQRDKKEDEIVRKQTNNGEHIDEWHKIDTVELCTVDHGATNYRKKKEKMLYA